MNRTDWIPSTVLAACVLHNICLDSNDMQIENYINAELNEVHGNDENGHIAYEHQNHEGRNRRDELCRQLFLYNDNEL
jgi:hypothetical protein